MSVKVVNHNSDFAMTFDEGDRWLTSSNGELNVLSGRGKDVPSVLATFAPGAWTHVTKER